MANKIKLLAKFPAEEQNGMTVLDDEWERIEDPNSVLVVARISRKDVLVSKEGPRVARAIIEQIELVPELATDQVLAVMRDACAARGGFMAAAPQTTLEGLDNIGGEEKA